MDKLKPESFELEYTSIWSFKDRGSWATHKGSYRGNCSPYVVRNLLLRYSEPGDLVLDQFVGGGTTLIESGLLKRKSIGVDINKRALGVCRKNISFLENTCYKPKLQIGSATNLKFIKSESIDIINTHPPYANIISYSKDIEGDISLYNINNYIKAMELVASESYRVLKIGKVCCLLIGDIRKDKKVIPLGFQIMNLFLKVGFILKEIIIKYQHNCKKTEFWIEKSKKYNFLLLEHEYIFVFEKN